MPNSEESARATQLVTAAQERIDAGDLQNARTLALKAVPILIKGVADRHLAGACFALSRVLADTREFDKAFQVLNAALDFFLTGGNAALDEFPIFLNRFGNLLREENRPVEAEPLLAEALKLSRAKAAPDQNLIATITNNLGLVFQQTGNLPAAQRAYEDLLAAYDAAHNEGPDVAITFDNLSSLYMQSGEDSKARPLTKRAIEIFAGSGPTNNGDLLTARVRLAQLDARAGNLAEAEKTLNDVLSLIAGDSKEAIHNFASASICRAEILRRSASYVEAEKTLQGVLACLKTAGLGRSGFFINASHQMARVLNAAGDYGGAFELLSALVERDDHEVASFAGSSSSLRALMYKERLDARFDELLWLVTKHLAGNAHAVEQAFLRAANRKQLITERLLRRARSVLHSSGPLREASAALRALRAQREEAILEGPGGGNLLVYRRHLADLTAQEEDLEARIAQASDDSGTFRRLASVGEVRAVLPRGTALVDIVRFSKFEIAHDDGARGAWTGHRYAAFVVEPETEQVKLIDLGDGDAIDGDVGRHLSELSEWRSGPLAAMSAKDGFGAALSAKIFAPIAAATSAKLLCLNSRGLSGRVAVRVAPSRRRLGHRRIPALLCHEQPRPARRHAGWALAVPRVRRGSSGLRHRRRRS